MYDVAQARGRFRFGVVLVLGGCGLLTEEFTFPEAGVEPGAASTGAGGEPLTGGGGIAGAGGEGGDEASCTTVFQDNFEGDALAVERWISEGPGDVRVDDGLRLVAPSPGDFVAVDSRFFFDISEGESCLFVEFAGQDLVDGSIALGLIDVVDDFDGWSIRYLDEFRIETATAEAIVEEVTPSDLRFARLCYRPDRVTHAVSSDGVTYLFTNTEAPPRQGPERDEIKVVLSLSGPAVMGEVRIASVRLCGARPLNRTTAD
ncbi:MAG: hypothetical protein AAGA56_24510 [Myxococcota bacterium]